ncbi:MAG: sulfotransferase domain-containing protein [Terrimicrobiaceae bacterium]|nr:sulfotransferase domain-containing protein [Terrimicrobiaceae bacterium]
MLIVSNGAFKSGSTWLTLVVRQIGTFIEVPAEFKNEAWKNNTIEPSRMGDFLRTAGIATNDYLIKSHYKPEDEVRPLLLATPGVKVLNVYRDPKDVVVSAYFHFRRLGQFDGTIEEFFERRGESLVRQLTRYHLYWDNRGVEDAIFFTTYQKLHTCFEDEVLRLGRFLGRELTVRDIQTARSNTQFSKLSGPAVPEEKRFFRKGVMGDWQRHLSPEQGAWIDRIEAEEGIYLILDEILC